jgi:hypothetical protein
MRIGKNIFAGLASASLLISPVVAHAAPTAKAQSTANVKRVVAVRKDENKLAGTAAILAALTAAAIIAAIVIAADSDDNTPVSI